MEAAAIPVKNVQRGRILVVEDEPIVSMAIEESLVKMGYVPCAIVDNGPEAIEIAGDLRPDCVLMDIQLVGEMDGIEAAERIVALYDIPVVYLTAQTDNQTLLRAMNTLPYGYLIKPFKKEQLYSTIERAVHKHRVLEKIKPKGARNVASVDLVHEAVMTLDGSFEVGMINPEAEKMTGWTAEEARGRDIFTLIGIEGDSADILKNTFKSEKGSNPLSFSWPGEYVIKTRYGKALNVETMIRTPKGEDSPDGEMFLFLRKKGEMVVDEPKKESGGGRDIKSLVDLIPEPAYIIDRGMRLVGYNIAFSELAQMLGITKLSLKNSIYSDNTMNNFGYRHEYEDTIRKNRKQTGTIGFSSKRTLYVGSVSRYPLKLDDGVVVLSVIWDFGPQKKKEDLQYPGEQEIEDIANKILDLESEFGGISSCINVIEGFSKTMLERIVYYKDSHPGFGEIEDIAWKEMSTINRMRAKTAEMKSKCHSIYGVWLLKGK